MSSTNDNVIINAKNRNGSSFKLSSLPLRPSTSTLLRQRGFETVADLDDAKISGGVSTLAAELHVELPKAMRILREVQDCLDTATRPRSKGSVLLTPALTITAGDILSSTRKSRKVAGIVSFCQSIDKLLDRRGVPLGSLTEIAGLPGVGKTQLAMQLAVNCRLPHSLGGVYGQTLYVDAEGSFAPDRLHAMAKSLIHHCKGTMHREGKALPGNFSRPEQIMQSVRVFRVHDEASQVATLFSLPQWIENAEIPVRLIIFDTIAFHYRASSDLYQRTRSLTQVAAFLNSLARKHDLAVVCLNQMTTKVVNGQSMVVPALGESWAHAVTTRLLLSDDHRKNRRVCRLVKSPSTPSGIAYYRLTHGGVRDTVSDLAGKESAAGNVRQGHRSLGDEGEAKRRRRTLPTEII